MDPAVAPLQLITGDDWPLSQLHSEHTATPNTISISQWVSVATTGSLPFRVSHLLISKTSLSVRCRFLWESHARLFPTQLSFVLPPIIGTRTIVWDSHNIFWLNSSYHTQDLHNFVSTSVLLQEPSSMEKACFGGSMARTVSLGRRRHSWAEDPLLRGNAQSIQYFVLENFHAQRELPPPGEMIAD